jgi:hypothetical protein
MLPMIVKDFLLAGKIGGYGYDLNREYVTLAFNNT